MDRPSGIANLQHLHPCTLSPDLVKTEHRTIYIHPQAPVKPPLGQACNGCGVCCTLSTCPLGWISTGRKQGPCAHLHWVDALLRYECNLLKQAQTSWANWPSAIRKPARYLTQRWVARQISAGSGCDCSYETTPHQTS